MLLVQLKAVMVGLKGKTILKKFSKKDIRRSELVKNGRVKMTGNREKMLERNTIGLRDGRRAILLI